MFTNQKEDRYQQLTTYIKENQEKFYRLAYSYAKEKQLALDIVQDAIVKALDKIETLRNPEYMKTWLYRILINECLSNVRKAKVASKVLIEDYDLQYEQKDTLEQWELYQKIEQLPTKLKTVILLRFFEDMKLEEITKITNTNLSTVKSRLYKALKELKIMIMEEKDHEIIS